jgi:type IV secretory pathway VirB2 component (pilin)
MFSFKKFAPVLMGVFVALAFTVAPFAGHDLAFASSSSIVNPGDRAEVVVNNPDLRETLVSILNYFLGFLGLLAVAFIIYAGILMVTAAGDEEGVTKGRKIILYSIIGIIIIFLSFTIVTFVARVPEAVPQG